MTSPLLRLLELAEESREERIVALAKKVGRIKFAFTGEDRDAIGVGEALQVINSYLALAASEPSQVTNTVCDAMEPMVQGLYETIDNLEQLAAMRCTAQGRWFTDKDGPDYTPPSQENPQDN